MYCHFWQVLEGGGGGGGLDFAQGVPLMVPHSSCRAVHEPGLYNGHMPGLAGNVTVWAMTTLFSMPPLPDLCNTMLPAPQVKVAVYAY